MEGKMASTSPEFCSNEGDRQVPVSERKLTELLMNLVFLKGERDQLKHQIDQIKGEHDKESLVANCIGGMSEEKIRHNPRKMCSSGAGFADGKVSQSHVNANPFEFGSSEMNSRNMPEKQPNANLSFNSADSGIGSRSDQGGGNLVNTQNRMVQGASSTQIPDITISHNLAIDSSLFDREFNQTHKFINARSEIQCGDDGSRFSPLMEAANAQKLRRATSSKEGEQSIDKNNKIFKKTGSCDSYFPKDSNRALFLPRFNYKQRRSSCTPMYGNSHSTLRTGDKSMASLPQLISKTVLNKVTQELRRVKIEYSRQENEKVVQYMMIQQLQEQIYSLNLKLKDKEMDLIKEKKENDEDCNRLILETLDKVQGELDKEKKRSQELEKILLDERRRFNRERKQKKENETSKKQVHT